MFMCLTVSDAVAFILSLSTWGLLRGNVWRRNREAGGAESRGQSCSSLASAVRVYSPLVFLWSISHSPHPSRSRPSLRPFPPPSTSSRLVSCGRGRANPTERIDCKPSFALEERSTCATRQSPLGLALGLQVVSETRSLGYWAVGPRYISDPYARELRDDFPVLWERPRARLEKGVVALVNGTRLALQGLAPSIVHPRISWFAVVSGAHFRV